MKFNRFTKSDWLAFPRAAHFGREVAGKRDSSPLVAYGTEVTVVISGDGVEWHFEGETTYSRYRYRHSTTQQGLDTWEALKRRVPRLRQVL